MLPQVGLSLNLHLLKRPLGLCYEHQNLGAVSYVFTVSDFFRMFIPLPIEPASRTWDNLWRLKLGSGPGPTPTLGRSLKY